MTERRILKCWRHWTEPDSITGRPIVKCVYPEYRLVRPPSFWREHSADLALCLGTVAVLAAALVLR